ncbi:PAS domain-containing sensor histidine kinase [Variovorax beijingensis]|uniref:PAS domain-containing sensor histidine kinase n=1 Tax=Variovorax beijingensis TaxID=2496117 RepID=UPI003F69A795
MQHDPTDDSDFPAGQPEHHFHGFLEAAPDAVVIIDGNGVIALVNSQTEQLFGYGRAELLGRPLEMLMPERYRGSHFAQTRAYTADPRARPMGSGLDLFGMRKDGSEFPIDVSISPLPPQKEIFIASTIRDMTSHRRLEEELRQRTRELEEADRQKDNFLSTVAHELRSPLTVLSLAVQFLRLPQADPRLHEQTLSRLERQTAYMARLIEDLLDLTRVRCGTFTLRREVVDLRSVFVTAAETAQPLIESREHRLELTPFPEPLWVIGDPARLIEVVSNLLNNAATYTPKGGRIWLSAAKEGQTVTVRIRDDGMGIPKEMLSRVFELFARAAPAEDSSAGLGIGLALVRRLVELHGGTVEATSDGPGKGSEFIVRLPLLPNGPEAGSGAAPYPAGT